MAARWSGGRVTMGTAGRDRRVRNNPCPKPAVKAKAKSEPRVSKKRQPGGRDEGEVDQSVGASSTDDLTLHFQNKAEKERVQGCKRPYTQPRDRSPGQKRGRTATLTRSPLSSRFSLDGILTSAPVELTEIGLETGILTNERQETVCSCGKQKWKIEARNNHCQYRCSCRKTESVVARDRDIFSQKLPLRSLFGALWLWCSPLNVSPDKGGLVLGVDNRVMRGLFDQFRSWLSPLVDQLNDELLIGGQGQDVEMDEICFRSKTLDNCVLWVRYFAMVRRGSSKVFLARLPCRITKAGQGGGGPISVQDCTLKSLGMR